MTNKFRIGELVIVNGKGKINQEKIRAIAIIECKEYYFNEYLVTIVSSNKQDWFQEKDIERVMERKFKKMEKYKVALVIEERGLDLIRQKIDSMPKQNNNILKKVDLYREYKAFKKKYVILAWVSTYWSNNNFVVKCIQDTLRDLRAKDIAYQQIIIGETNPTYVKIDEFTENDKNVDIFNIVHKIEVKKIGGILI